ncbi:MAG: glutathione S-transferase family protein, partial [Lachnospiraceae bacterium]|nr:glutathione S-transferase family protein [Lachnospiraceae bacterium]
KRMLRDYPNLWNYARDLYTIPAFGGTTDFEAIKKHYHLCCLATNPKGILPLGPEETLWNEPHNRDRIY